MDYKSQYKGKNILITGGAGCIGSNLTRALIKADVDKITILDNLSASRVWNIPESDKVRFIFGDIASVSTLNKVFAGERQGNTVISEGSKYDIIFHLAAHFANQNSVDHPEADLDTNGLGTLMLLAHAVSNGVSRFVYASSGCSVYGSEAPLPLVEDYVSLHLDTPYQIHKLLGELYCNYLFNYRKLPVAIARYFNVYGQGEIPGAYRNVIPNFMWRAIHNQPLIITGTGEETRDFTYVGDIVDGTMRLGVMPEAIGQAFNLASSKETKVIEIADIINGITNNKSGLEYGKVRSWDKITRRRASIDKAHKILGYTPKTDIEDGIKEVYNWIIENKDKIERDARF